MLGSSSLRASQDGELSVVPDGHGVVKALRLAVMADDLRIAPVAATVFRHGSVARGRCSKNGSSACPSRRSSVRRVVLRRASHRAALGLTHCVVVHPARNLAPPPCISSCPRYSPVRSSAGELRLLALGRDAGDVPRQPEPLEHPDQSGGGVDLPPFQAVLG
jgi:hypothetical protein